MATQQSDRILEASGVYFRSGKTVPDLVITSIEGVTEEPGKLTLKPLLVGSEMVFLQAFKAKGMIDPIHQHDDHESIGYLISGRMRLVIGGQESLAEPGDAWLHPRGVPHFSEALEDCVQVEVKSPPRKTWSSAN
jgi:quercetin dioxygenase-like cupin family protein